MLLASYRPYILQFKRPSGTSRGIMTEKETWLLILEKDGKKGIGECGLLRGLSIDDRPDYEAKLRWVCAHIHEGLPFLLEGVKEFPSIRFGLEQAFLSLKSETPFLLFPSFFTTGDDNIPINGLVWMGEKALMRSQIEEKVASGFSCIKLKIGAIDFEEELTLLRYIRNEFTAKDIEIRVDANGAFAPAEALEKLKRLSSFDLHSIEQPIKPDQWEAMARLCEVSPLPIALDEELIGIFDVTKKRELLQTIQPQYIILKPSLVGGYAASDQWIDVAAANNIGWWITSALESNIGLNAIAQWTYTLGSEMPQGLGTGSLFANNFESPLHVTQGMLCYNTDLQWNTNLEI